MSGGRNSHSSYLVENQQYWLPEWVSDCLRCCSCENNSSGTQVQGPVRERIAKGSGGSAGGGRPLIPVSILLNSARNKTISSGYSARKFSLNGYQIQCYVALLVRNSDDKEFARISYYFSWLIKKMVMCRVWTDFQYISCGASCRTIRLFMFVYQTSSVISLKLCILFSNQANDEEEPYLQRSVDTLSL